VVTVTAEYELQVDPQGAERKAAEGCEASVFLSVYGNTEAELQEEYGRYEHSSVFLSVADRAGEVIGACRIVLPSVAGLKTLNDLSREPWTVDGYRSAAAAGLDPARTLDVATIGVRRGVKGPALLASMAMYHGIVALSRANDLPYVVMIMDERARRLLTSISCPTNLLPGTEPGAYLGSTTSTPLWASVPDMMDYQRRANPEAHRLVSDGAGLTGIHIPPPDRFKLGSSPAAVPVPEPMPAAESRPRALSA
jgi:hypothetical protein